MDTDNPPSPWVPGIRDLAFLDPVGVPSSRSTVAIDPNRPALIRRAFWLEDVTVAWMMVEAAVAIWAAMQAGSVSLLAFGSDSVIELASAGVLIWRLTVELRHGQVFAESAERTASRIAGGLLFALAAYVVTAAGWKILDADGGDVFLARTGHHYACNTGDVCPRSAEDRNCRSAWQQGDARGCNGKRDVWLVVRSGRGGPPCTRSNRCMVGRIL